MTNIKENGLEMNLYSQMDRKKIGISELDCEHFTVQVTEQSKTENKIAFCNWVKLVSYLVMRYSNKLNFQEQTICREDRAEKGQKRNS